MSTLTRLIKRIYLSVRRDPQAFLAMQLSYAGQTMSWSVWSGTLTTTVSGEAGPSLSIDLTQYTLAGLAMFLASQEGYSVTNTIGSALSGLGAVTLVEGSGSQEVGAGGALMAFQNLNWTLLDAARQQTDLARVAIQSLPGEMSTTTADGEWLDLLGSYYGVPRMALEPDGQYGLRIIAQTLELKCNNVAIAVAIQLYTGQMVTVVDASVPALLFDGTYNDDGSIDANGNPTPTYGLFNVAVGYDLINGGTVAAFEATVTSVVNSLRAAGTFMQSLTLGGSTLIDALPAPAEGGDFLTISYAETFGGQYVMDGTLQADGSFMVSGTLES